MKSWGRITINDIFKEISVQSVDDVAGKVGQFFDYLDDDGDVQRVQAAWEEVTNTEKDEFSDDEHMKPAKVLHSKMTERELAIK